MKKVCAIIASILVGWAVPAQAGPLELKDVPADATWVAHVDVDAARASQVVQKFAQQCHKDWPEAGEELAKFSGKLGLDACKDLHGITAYGTKLAPHHGILIAEAKWHAQALLDYVRKAPDHETTDYGEHPIHTWTAHKHRGHVHQLAAALYKPEILVVAPSPELLKSALNVLDGKAASLAGKQSPLAAEVPPGTVFLARLVDLKDTAIARTHPVLQRIESFRYEKGEHEGRWFGNLAVTADSQPAAEKLGKILEGFGAWLSLHADKSSWFVDLLNKTKLNVEGKVVKVTFQEPASAVAAVIPQVCKAIEEHAKMHAAVMKTPCPMMKKMHCPMMKKAQ